MATASIRHHTEETLHEAIFRLMSECSTCRVAVAFCGEASHRFFPESAEDRPADLRIIIDASQAAIKRGLSNPNGIGRLLGLTDQVRSLTGLHAKAWVFDDRSALIGSANLSSGSILQQYQLAVEISDRPTVRRNVRWFDGLWANENATPLDSDSVDHLRHLWPHGEGEGSRARTKGKLPNWRRGAPEAPLSVSDIEVGIDDEALKRLLQLFGTQKCRYPNSRGSCFEEALRTEGEYAELGRKLRSLMRKRSSWRREDLATIFDIAYYNGSAAKLMKPRFVRESPARVSRSMEFLLIGPRDSAYSRFQKVLEPRGEYKIPYMSEAGLSFFMHLWSPGDYALVNAPIITALEMLKVKFLRRSHLAFRDHVAAVTKIRKQSGLASFVLTGQFLDAIAKGHIALSDGPNRRRAKGGH